MNPLNSLPPFKALSLDDDDAKTLLGPLYDFAGEWTNDPLQGWNLIAVPGPLVNNGEPNFFNSAKGFFLETIPYIETICFKPISVTLNRGTFQGNPGEQQIQQIGALLYEQKIKSAGVDPSNPHYKEINKFFEDRGFAKDTPIHAEQGMLLNINNLTENFQIARMGVIPHGNTMLCLGTAVETNGVPPNIPADGNDPTPTTTDPKRNLPFDYTVNTYLPPNHKLAGYPFYPDFIPTSPNLTLINANKKVKFSGSTRISLSTLNGTGGLLSIPFVGGGLDHKDSTRINTTQMTVDYWISKEDSGAIRLQYAQNINLIFPSQTDPTLPINWPHIGLNTLKWVSKC